MYQIIQVNNIQIPELALYNTRSETALYHAYEPEPGLFIAESAKCISRALAAGYDPVSLVIEEECLSTNNKETAQLLAQIEDLPLSIPLYTAPHLLLKDITGHNLTMGMLCLFRRRALPSLEEVCAGKKRIVILDDVENPTNVGAIIRSAAALGVEAILLTSHCSDPLYRRASRVSMGNVFLLPWTFIQEYNRPSYIKQVQALGFKTVAMALNENSVTITDPQLNQEEKLAIIMGNEGFGLSEDVLSETDYTVLIPMTPGVDSLNVAAASAVAFYQLCM